MAILMVHAVANIGQHYKAAHNCGQHWLLFWSVLWPEVANKTMRPITVADHTPGHGQWLWSVVEF
jgi:hypothetical protein